MTFFKRALALVVTIGLSAGSASAQSSGSSSAQAGLAKVAGLGSTAMSLVMVKTEWPKCTASHGASAMSCMIVVVGGASAAASILGAMGAGDAQNSISDGSPSGSCAPSDFSCQSANNGGAPPSGPTVSGLPPDVKAAVDGANALGYSYNPSTDTITTPKGKFPSSVLSSGKAMADAGLIGKDQIAAIDQKLLDMQNKFKVAAVPIGGGAGGGGGGGSGSVRYEYGSSMGGSGALKVNGPRTNGLTRTLASGEVIGSMVDDIFEMVSRKYQEKSRENIFVGQLPAQAPAGASAAQKNH